MDSSNNTFLHALKHGNLEINQIDQYGNTILHYAVNLGDVESVMFLLNTPHINANIQNVYGKTALAEASPSLRPGENAQLTHARTRIFNLLLNHILHQATKDEQEEHKTLTPNPVLSFAHRANPYKRPRSPVRSPENEDDIAAASMLKLSKRMSD